VIEHIARIRIQLPTNCPEGAFRTVALGQLPSGPGGQLPSAPPSRHPRQINPNASHNELSHSDQAIEGLARACQQTCKTASHRA
jgi:hypothetical protein